MNFRLTVQFEGDKPERTTLDEFLLDNEAAPDVCDRVRALAPGESTTAGGGAGPLVTITRAAKTEQRFTHVRVPISFDRAEYATVTIDRKRLTLSIRPARRRSRIELGLREWVEKMLWKQVAVNVNARKRRKKAR